jgi:hypothetical protein
MGSDVVCRMSPPSEPWAHASEGNLAFVLVANSKGTEAPDSGMPSGFRILILNFPVRLVAHPSSIPPQWHIPFHSQAALGP